MFLQNPCFICSKYYLIAHKNYQSICQKCGDQTLVSRIKSPKYKCPQCTYQNSQQNIQCVVCQLVFQHKLIQALVLQPINSKPDIIICLECKYQNPISCLSQNSCLKCFGKIYEPKKKSCSVCTLEVEAQYYQNHSIACFLSKQAIQQEQKNERSISAQKKLQSIKNIQPILKKPQPIFIKKFLKQKKPQIIKKAEQIVKFNPISRLTGLQNEAINYMHTKSLTQHKDLRISLQKRVKILGYSQKDLQNLEFYIQNHAPIIIQIHISKHMEFFLKDTHYRNQFQTNKSSGSLNRQSRIQWEDRMFDNKYHNAKDFQKVKYGAINFANDPKGVKGAVSYGPSYFLLRSHVRQRCTFTDQDSSAANAVIATLKYSFAVVNKMTDKQLKAAFNASKAMQQSSSVTPTYKQIQVHGPIQFSKDVERLYANKQQTKDSKYLNMVYQFCQKNKLQYDFI